MSLIRVLGFCFVVCFCFASLDVGESSAEQIHPRNQIIKKMYPRKDALRFPDVPRITAFAALHYQRTGQAYFVHIGDEGETALGGLHLREDVAANYSPYQLLSKFKDKYIVLYCH